MTEGEIYRRCIRELGASRTFSQLLTAKRYYELFLKTVSKGIVARNNTLVMTGNYTIYKMFLDEMFRVNKRRLQ